jgi:hypothetical protein
LQEKLGKGAKGTVYKALDLKTHETVAVKKIQWTNRPGKDMVRNCRKSCEKGKKRKRRTS